MGKQQRTAENPDVDRAAVMFSDIAGSTALYRELGDAKAEKFIRLAMGRLEHACTQGGGKVIKTIGDELMSRYATGQDAALAAMEMQRTSATPIDESGKKFSVRIGFAFGSVVERDDDLYGDIVNVAARLAAMAKAGQVLTTEVTVQTFDRELRACTRLFDKTPVKGIKDEISVVQVLWERRDQTSIVAVSPSATAMALKLSLRYRDQEMKLEPSDLPMRLGRADECDLVVASDFASRMHARLDYNRGKFMLVDESTNGTYVEIEDAGSGGQRIVYLRNESFAMVGEGRFSLGTRPEADPHVLHFRTA